MRFSTIILIFTFFISCKKNKQKSINDFEFIDSIKNTYTSFSKENEKKRYRIHIGLNDFCFENERFRLHKKIFKEKEDIRITDQFVHYQTIEEITTEELDSFTIKEKLIFALVYPEQHSQTCSKYIELNEEMNQHIFSYLPKGDEGFYPSERQIEALKENKDSVAFYLKQCYKNKDQIPFDIYLIVEEINLYQLIPLLIEHNNSKKNSFILALMIRLMMDDKYKPFLNSNLIKDLSDPNSKIINHRDLKITKKTKEREEELLFHIQNYYTWKSNNSY